MKKSLLFPVLAFVTVFTACGPAAEDRNEMHRRSKIFQDSIANVIKISMDEAAAPAQNGPPVAMPAPTPAATPTAPAK